MFRYSKTRTVAKYINKRIINATPKQKVTKNQIYQNVFVRNKKHF